jgi:DNA-binding protein H-NS
MPTDQSLDEIRTQLDELEQAKVELERQLHERWKAQKRELAQQIREMIDAQGYDAEEIMALVLPRRRGRKAQSQGSYTTYVDPENPDNVYVRGPLPTWMKEKMTAQGYDPASREDRDAFKVNYLRAQSG